MEWMDGGTAESVPLSALKRQKGAKSDKMGNNH